jgi:hypothetical protein
VSNDATRKQRKSSMRSSRQSQLDVAPQSTCTSTENIEKRSSTQGTKRKERARGGSRISSSSAPHQAAAAASSAFLLHFILPSRAPSHARLFARRNIAAPTLPSQVSQSLFFPPSLAPFPTSATVSPAKEREQSRRTKNNLGLQGRSSSSPGIKTSRSTPKPAVKGRDEGYSVTDARSGCGGGCGTADRIRRANVGLGRAGVGGRDEEERGKKDDARVDRRRCGTVTVRQAQRLCAGCCGAPSERAEVALCSPLLLPPSRSPSHDQLEKSSTAVAASPGAS